MLGLKGSHYTPVNGSLTTSFFANLFRITEITWSILSTLTFKDN